MKRGKESGPNAGSKLEPVAPKPTTQGVPTMTVKPDRRARENDLAAFALTAGALSALVTMALHPTGHDVAAGRAGLAVTVHALALAGIPLSVYGLAVLTRRLAVREPLAGLALSFYGVAAIAGLLAAVASGFVATALLASLGERSGTDRVVAAALVHWTGSWNQAFARVHVASSSLAIALWSVTFLRSGLLPRRVAVYGLVVAVLTLIALLSGHLRLDIHGFGAVVLAQTVWMVVVGLHLRRLGRGF
jgi:hypothetical protein